MQAVFQTEATKSPCACAIHDTEANRMNLSESLTMPHWRCVPKMAAWEFPYRADQLKKPPLYQQTKLQYKQKWKRIASRWILTSKMKPG
jgi:hypothetical protein